MYNKVTMVGNLTRDVELKYLPTGSALGKTAIATTYSYKSQTGEKKEEVCFIDLTFFGRSAEVANQYLKKGSKVLVEGRLIFEQWTAQDGSNRSRHTLRVEEMKMLDSKPQSGNNDYGGGYSNNNSGNYNNNNNSNSNYGGQNRQQGYNGYNGNQNQSNQQYGRNDARPTAENLPEIDIDEEIPF